MVKVVPSLNFNKIWYLRMYQWVDTSAGGLFVPLCIIRRMVSASLLTISPIVYHSSNGQCFVIDY